MTAGMVAAGRDTGGGDGIGADTGGSFDAAGGLGAGALAAAFEALPPRAGIGAGAGAGGGDSTIVGSRSLPVSRARPDAAGAGAEGSGTAGCVRGTPGKPPARGDVRASGVAAAESPGDEPDDEDDGGDADAGVVPRSVRRVSRCGPGQSQIERCESPGAGALVEVANAGVRPGNAGALGGLGALGGGGAGGATLADDACAAAFPDVVVVSGSSLIASPFSSPVEASVGLPS